MLQEALNSNVFRVYLNDDLIGVELCAAAKNVIALAAGACDGLGAGDNAKAALMTRGLAEMARLGDRGRRRPRDVLRARRDGRPDRHLLASERTQPARRRADRPRRDTPEAGRRADRPGRRGADDRAACCVTSSRRLGVELPITESVCSVLEGRPLAELAAGLMGRAPTDE